MIRVLANVFSILANVVSTLANVVSVLAGREKIHYFTVTVNTWFNNDLKSGR